ncbi:MAG: hypothetical protein FJ285_04625 [Planctomycetes bacterium]|nr:hypothetical protein [Planctomycetota bacterium]
MSEAAELPRGLVVAVGCWFAFACAAAFAPTLPLHLAPSTLTPGISQTLVLCTMALWVGWPLLRLSAPPTRAPSTQALLDAVTLAFLIQLPLWPLRLGTPWPVQRTLLIDLHVLAGLASVTGLVAVGTAVSSGWVRAAAMAGCMVVATGVHLPLGAMGGAPHAASAMLPGGIPALLDRMRSNMTIPTVDDWSAALLLWIVSVVTAVGGLLLASLLARLTDGARAVASTRRVG